LEGVVATDAVKSWMGRPRVIIAVSRSRRSPPGQLRRNGIPAGAAIFNLTAALELYELLAQNTTCPKRRWISW
jgi:hypothetical protein